MEETDSALGFVWRLMFGEGGGERGTLAKKLLRYLMKQQLYQLPKILLEAFDLL